MSLHVKPLFSLLTPCIRRPFTFMQCLIWWGCWQLLITNCPAVYVCPRVFENVKFICALKPISHPCDSDYSQRLCLELLLVHSGWCRQVVPVSVNLFGQGWFLVTVHTCRWESYPTYGVEYEERRPGVKRENIKGKISVSWVPFWLIWRTFVTKTRTLTQQSSVMLILNCLEGGRKNWIVNENYVLFNHFCYISPLLICPSHHAPNTSLTPEFGPGLTCLHFWSYNILMFVSSSGQSVRTVGVAVWITLLSKKSLIALVFVPLEKKGGKVMQLIQQPKPNLATYENGFFSTFGFISSRWHFSCVKVKCMCVQFCTVLTLQAVSWFMCCLD